MVKTKINEVGSVLCQPVDDKEIVDTIRQIALEKIFEKRVLGAFCDAFSKIEKDRKRVADVVIDNQTLDILRKYGGDNFIETAPAQKRHQRHGSLWGASVWVDKVVGVNCYGTGSRVLAKKFPKIAAAKKLFGLDKV
jgi:hypothetical protein